MGNQYDRYEYEAKDICECGYARGSLGCQSEHDEAVSDDVAAVLADAVHLYVCDEGEGLHAKGQCGIAAAEALAALTEAGIACVYVPAGVAVEHGSWLTFPKHHEQGAACWSIEPPEATP